VNLHHICWQLGPGGQVTVIFFILAAALARGPVTFFWNETSFSELLEPIKQHLKIIKIRTIRIWTFSI
jgi:hypothetical protein